MKKSSIIVILLIIAFFYIPVFEGGAALNRTLKPAEIQKLKDNVIRDPSNMKSRRFLAEHYAKTKDWRRVVAYLKPVAELLPESSLNHLAQAYLSTQDLKGAESVTKIMLSRKELSVKGVRMLVLIWSAQIRQLPTSEAEAASRQAKINQTIDILKKAEIAHPSETELYKLHISFLKEFIDHYAFDALKVIDDLEANIKKESAEETLSPKFYSMRCQFSYMSQFTKKAKEVCEAAIERDPDNHKNFIWLGRILMNTGDPKRGKRMLASVGKRFSDSEDALRSTGQFYLESKNLPKAYEYFQKATKHKDASSEAYLGLGTVAFELKKYKEALGAFTTHCRKTKFLHQEFRKASGLLKDQPKWQKTYRNTMRSCNANP